MISSKPEGPWAFVRGPGPTWGPTGSPLHNVVLCFLPGAGEIAQLLSMLRSRLGSECWAWPLHAGLSVEEQQQCFSMDWPSGCTCKVVCATNIAETSVTVPGVTVVIDSGRERRMSVDKHSNTPVLKEQWCTLASLQQRRGRAGRVQPGVYFQLIPRGCLEQLDEATQPEIQRTPLENLYLQAFGIGVENCPAFLACTPSPPDPVCVISAEAALRDLGAFDTCATGGRGTAVCLSPLGWHLAALPCHPRLGKLLVLGCFLSCPRPCLSVVAALSAHSPMLTTQDGDLRSQWEVARLQLMEELGCLSDHCIIAALSDKWLQAPGPRRRKELCSEFGFSFEKMCALRDERRHLAEALISTGLLPCNFLRQEHEVQATYDTDWTMVRSAIAGGLYPCILRASPGLEREVRADGTIQNIRCAKYTILQHDVCAKDTKGAEFVCEEPIALHPSSLLFGEDGYHCPWLASFHVQRMGSDDELVTFDASEVPPYALMLFGAPPEVDAISGHIVVGGWARFRCAASARALPAICAARAALQRILGQKLQDPDFDHTASSEFAVCLELLRSNGLGFQRTSG